MKRALFASAAAAIAIGAAVAVMATDSPIVTEGVSIAAANAKTVTLYKNPRCSCCEGYADYLRTNGYAVTVKATHNLSLIKRERGVPEKLDGCHTSLVDGYVVEGHVPVATLNKLLTERPQITGISLPGMPAGSPGMTGAKADPFKIYEISRGMANRAPKVYAVE